MNDNNGFSALRMVKSYTQPLVDMESVSTPFSHLAIISYSLKRAMARHQNETRHAAKSTQEQ